MKLQLPAKWKGFGPFLWHGFFLALTMAMIEPNTVLPTLVSSLTSSTLIFGLMYSILLGAPLLFNLPFSRFQHRFPKKRSFLLVGIYTRSFSFVGMAGATLLWGQASPDLALVILAVLVLLFAASGGFAGIAYTDMVGQTIAIQQRPSMYAVRQVFGGVGSLIGAVVLTWMFRPGNLAFPLNYAIGLLIGAGGLLVGSFGFWRIRETAHSPSAESPKPIPPREGLVSILKRDARFRRFIIIENLSGFSLMLLPFYMVFITTRFPQAREWIGIFMIAQTVGSIGSNFMWASVARRFKPRTVARLCMSIGGIIPLLALLLQPLGPAWFTLLFLLIGFVLSGRNIGFEPYLLEIAPADQRTLYLGIRGSLSILIAFLPVLGGFLISQLGFELAFVTVAIVMLLGSWLWAEKRLAPI